MHSGTRIETDLMGDVVLPADALYGVQTMRAVGNFQISGRTASSALVRAYLTLKWAAAEANLLAGALTAAQSDLIVRAVKSLLETDESRYPSLFPVDPFQAGAGTSLNMNVNEVVANTANLIAGHPLGRYDLVHPNDHVNRSQSTNDSFPTAMRLALLEASDPLLVSTCALADALQAKAEAWWDIPKSARTHLQDAVPMRLGQEIQGYAATVRGCSQWIAQGRDALRVLGISGSAAGTGLTVPAAYHDAIVPILSRLTNTDLKLADDLCEAMQSQRAVSYYSSMLRVAALELTRICNDLRLLASGPMTGLAEIQLPAVQAGSSIMPGKVNPSILEMCNQTLFAVLGHDQTVAYAVQAGQLQLNVMMPVMAHAMLEATTLFTNCLYALREKCIEGMTANETRLRRYFESTPQVATALSPVLGYEATAKLVKESIERYVSVIDLVRERALVGEEELARRLSVEALTGSGPRPRSAA